MKIILNLWIQWKYLREWLKGFVGYAVELGDQILSTADLHSNRKLSNQRTAEEGNPLVKNFITSFLIPKIFGKYQLFPC